MNTLTILTAITSLLTGGFIGTQMSKDAGRAIHNQEVQESQVAEHTPQADDYLSLRPSVSSLATEELSDAERDGLIYMREEEKLARDVYTTLEDVWGLQIFGNIAQSEQTHTEAVCDLLLRYGVSDPVTNDAIGMFTNPEFTELYQSLVKQGSVSLVDALTVGATIEDLDISDLKTRLEATDNADIALVYNNLTRGSRNHLRSFVSQIESRGGTYDAQYLSEEEVAAIVSSPRETGNGGGNASQGGQRGAGRGWGGR